jgi:hypothetical protein
MINEVSKLIEPHIDSENIVQSWTFGLECECSVSGTSGYTEVVYTPEVLQGLNSWTKEVIDDAYDSQDLTSKVTSQINAKNNRTIVDSDFDYNSL